MDTKPQLKLVDTDPSGSSRKGLKGLFEATLRKFKILVHFAMLAPMYALASAVVGTAFIPGVALFGWASRTTSGSSELTRMFAQGSSIAAGYFLYGFSMIFLVPALCFVLRARPKPSRGPYYSLETVRWYIANSFLYLVRYTFLEFVTPTPFNILFYRMMGMKIGRGCQINSSHISDPSLIEMGNKVTIGGSAVIVAHYGQAGYLVLAPVRIGDGATIGLRATVMGGVEIGANAKIMPNSVLLPKTVVPAGEVWGGVPAQKIDLRKVA